MTILHNDSAPNPDKIRPFTEERSDFLTPEQFYKQQWGMTKEELNEGASKPDADD